MWWSFSAVAATWSVPGDFPDLDQALQSTTVTSGDTIQVDAGTWPSGGFGYDFPPGRDLIVEGVGPTTLLTGSSGPHVISVIDANVVLRNLSVDCGSAATGVEVEDFGTLVLEQVDLGGCLDGGGRAQNGGTLTVRDSTVHDNENPGLMGNGGGLIALGGTIRVENSTLTNNHAGSDGGGIYGNNASSIQVLGSTLQGNNAASQGGAIRTAGVLSVQRSVFDGNSAETGGALYTRDAAVLSEVDIRGNEAEQASALMAFAGGIAERVRFIGNVAAAGGTVDSRSAWDFHNVYFCGNEVNGLAMLQNDNIVDMRNTLMIDNIIVAGALTLDLDHGIVENSTFLPSQNASWVSTVDVEAHTSVFVDDDFPDAEFDAGSSNHFFMVEPFGSSPTTGDPSYAVDRSGGCDTAQGAFPTARVIDVGPGVDVDGSPQDLGHRGGPSFDATFWGPAVLDADGDGADASIDCDDADPDRYPGAPEGCNGIDNDCDGVAEAILTLYSDLDGDTFGDPATATSTCPAPGLVDNSGDCDDADPDRFPGAVEICDGVDNDCDAEVDGADAVDASPYWLDADDDGYGMDSVMVVSCSAPNDYVGTDGDCDDADSARFPGAPEACVDGVDNDCDGLVDTEDPDFDPVGVEFWLDDDGDGYGVSTDGLVACPGDDPHGYAPASAGEDCDDTDSELHPGAVEVCDGLDNDCNGDDDDGLVFTPYFPDGDGDGFGEAGSSPTLSCQPIVDQVPDSTDCVDDDPAVHPGATELCDGIDQDCDDDIDEDVLFEDYYPDGDGDGFGDATSSPISDCADVPGHVVNAEDCDDTEAAVSPDADEVPDDGIDNDCDGVEATTPPFVDADGDGVPTEIDPDDGSAGDIQTVPRPDPVFGVGCRTAVGPSGWIDGLRRRR